MTSRGPVVVEVGHGSASSWDRSASMAFLVRVRRGGGSLIVAIGLSRDYAESLAERLGNLPRLSHPHAITMIPKTTHVHESVLSHRVGFVLIERGDRQRVPRRCLSGIYIDCDDLARIALCPCRLSFNSARRFHEW